VVADRHIAVTWMSQNQWMERGIRRHGKIIEMCKNLASF
jgi:hypothetical protein